MTTQKIPGSRFEFVAVASARARQLLRGCTPRVEQCAKVAVTAQHEVAERKVLRMPPALDALISND